MGIRLMVLMFLAISAVRTNTSLSDEPKEKSEPKEAERRVDPSENPGTIRTTLPTPTRAAQSVSDPLLFHNMPPHLMHGHGRTPADAAQYVSVVLQIDGATDGPPYGLSTRSDVQTVVTLLESTSVIDAALAKSLKLNAADRRALVVVAASPVGSRLAKVEVALRKSKADWKPDAADELLAALCSQVKAAYEESASVTARRQQSEADELERQRQALTTKLSDVRSKMAVVNNLSRTRLSGGMEPEFAQQQLRQQVSSLEKELARNKSRLAALVEVEKGPESQWDTVIKLLENKQTVLKKRKEAGKEVDEELVDIELKLAEARAQSASTKPVKSDRSDSQYEQRQLQQQIFSLENQLAPLNEQLSKLEQPEVKTAFANFKDYRQQEQTLSRELNELNSLITQAKRNLRTSPSLSITVIDGVPDVEAGK